MASTELLDSQKHKDRGVGGWSIALAVAVVPLTLVHYYLVSADDVPLGRLNGWIWIGWQKPYGAPWLLALLASVPLLTVLGVGWLRDRSAVKVGLLFALGVGLQFAFGWTEGRGIDTLRERIVSGTHYELAQVATRQEEIAELLTHYEELATAGELGRFAKSKPPGQLLLYVGTQRLAQMIHPHETYDEQLAWFQTFATYTWPVLSYLVLIPLFLLTRDLFGGERAIIACILYLFVPSVNLIVLHTDQVFYPAFFVLALYMAHLACARRSVAFGLFAGGIIYAVVFCTFAMLLLAPLVLAICFYVAYQNGLSHAPIRQGLRHAFVIFAGAVIVDFGCRLVFEYDIFVRYRAATAHHIAWYGWDGRPATVAYYAMLVSIEFIVWTGIPLVVLAVAGGCAGLADLGRRRFTAAACTGTGLACVFGALLLFGKTKAEAPRLWLFLVPCVCMLAAHAIETRFGSMRRWIVPAVVVLQGLSVYIIKVYQDFW